MTSRSECWERFKAAVLGAREGHYGIGNALIEAIRQKHGDEAAEIQRRELRRYVDSDKPA
ncbi:hypothetical protein GCT13_08320 [Paraburkholderia sp. CNPSo 3157]|uniref:Uncharacterized protein n=1 Tax=Paraburkholderia franconis TaxID=2654983 RepID=A0A7X1TF24_9BURK|nr:hypothetical protein [Paraburkholderia franconis]